MSVRRLSGIVLSCCVLCCVLRCPLARKKASFSQSNHFLSMVSSCRQKKTPCMCFYANNQPKPKSHRSSARHSRRGQEITPSTRWTVGYIQPMVLPSTLARPGSAAASGLCDEAARMTHYVLVRLVDMTGSKWDGRRTRIIIKIIKGRQHKNTSKQTHAPPLPPVDVDVDSHIDICIMHANEYQHLVLVDKRKSRGPRGHNKELAGAIRRSQKTHTQQKR